LPNTGDNYIQQKRNTGLVKEGAHQRQKAGNQQNRNARAETLQKKCADQLRVKNCKKRFLIFIPIATILCKLAITSAYTRRQLGMQKKHFVH